MEEFTKLEENGHETINRMVEKCASIAKKFFDNMERDNIEDLDEEGEEIEVGNVFDDNDDDGGSVDTDDEIFQPRNMVDV